MHSRTTTSVTVRTVPTSYSRCHGTDNNSLTQCLRRTAASLVRAYYYYQKGVHYTAKKKEAKVLLRQLCHFDAKVMSLVKELTFLFPDGGADGLTPYRRRRQIDSYELNVLYIMCNVLKRMIPPHVLTGRGYDTSTSAGRDERRSDLRRRWELRNTQTLAEHLKQNPDADRSMERPHMNAHRKGLGDWRKWS